MAKKKYYAVKAGRTTGIFTTWDACKASVAGYSGAEYKGFPTKEEAEAYLSESGKKEDAENLETSTPPHHITAYVDGSFMEGISGYSFGCVILTPQGEVIRESGCGDEAEGISMRNVAGELMGAMFAVEWCKEHGCSAVTICHDYTGIEMWATGKWKTNKQMTQQYAEYMKENSASIDITFKKIAAHTGDKYNEEADQLAKSALLNP